MEVDPSIFPDKTFHPLRRIGGAILGLFQMHQLSSHGDHDFDRVIDLTEPVEIPEDTQLKLDYYTLEP